MAAATDIGQLASDAASIQPDVSRGRLLAARILANRLGVVGIVWLVLIIFVALFADFVAPYEVDHVHKDALRAPPQRVHFFEKDSWQLTRPFVYGYKSERDARTFLTTYTEDPEKVYPIRFFVQGEPYRLWGLIPSQLRLFGVDEGGMIALLGTGRLGRDVLSRVLMATRISLSVPIIGMLISVILGSAIGVASGYWGGLADTLIQRLTEVLMSFPRIPLWMALAATLPADLSSLNRYLGVTIVLALIGWAGLCRQIRGKTLALKESDFIMASRAAGSSTSTILFGHQVPNCFSHIVVVATLSVPGLILAEGALSFLGIGITPPLVSWGTLLKDAQSVQVLTKHPWLLAPGVFMVLTVLAVNFLGDALRDALDPYSKIR
ncbi:ABC transporter permease [Chloroflexi bacterium TSY]|nr:ABC transporter permease [Chloroflexi bacterium TSY]